jgi:flagellar export protein FliJ
VKKFDFALESVLRLRQTQLTIQRNKLQQLFAERSKLERNLTSITDERAESSSWIQGFPGTTSSDMRAFSAFLLGSKSRETMLRHAIEICEADIVDQRARTLTAERNQKLLLNLKAKKRFEWQVDFDRELEQTAQEVWQSVAHSKTDYKEDT